MSDYVNGVLKTKVAVVAKFGDVMVPIFERWSGMACLTELHNLDTDVVSDLPSETEYRDNSRRSMLLVGPNSSSLSALSYDEQRPGKNTKDAFYIDNCIVVNLVQFFEDAEPELVVAAQQAACELVKLLNEEFGVEQAYIKRQDSLSCSPSTGMAECGALLTVVDPEELEEHHPPDMFWSAWDSRIELKNGLSLVCRVLDQGDDFNFQKSIFKHQWELARHSCKPEDVTFGEILETIRNPHRVAECEELLKSEGGTSLHGFHYDPQEKVLDVTAWTEMGTFVRPSEIMQLLTWRLNGQYDDGSPIETIRVTFPTLEQASAQAPILFEIECEVWYLNDQTTQPEKLKDTRVRPSVG
ncbi:MAG: hypothetical protein ABJH45_14695 [Paracoccaceae bacterium]